MSLVFLRPGRFLRNSSLVAAYQLLAVNDVSTLHALNELA